jgi:hypothetical protein
MMRTILAAAATLIAVSVAWGDDNLPIKVPEATADDGSTATIISGDEDSVSGEYSTAIGRGQTVTEPYHLRIGSDKDHWIDIDMRNGAATLAPGMRQSEIGDMCFSAFKAVHLLPAQH